MGLRTLFAATLSIGLAACTTPAPDSAGAQGQPKIERLGQYLYMVPVGRDGRGCVAYMVESPLRRYDKSLYWRVGKGNFTTDPEAAQCI